MHSLESEKKRLRRELRRVRHVIEDVGHRLADASGDQAHELQLEARHRLDRVRSRAGELEHEVAMHARDAGDRSWRYVQRHPWLFILAAGASWAMLYALARPRR